MTGAAAAEVHKSRSMPRPVGCSLTPAILSVTTRTLGLPRFPGKGGDVNVNLVVLFGQLVADPEVRRLDASTEAIRYLVMTTLDGPQRRVDVVPVISWQPLPSSCDSRARKGARIWVVGSIQRRFAEGAEGRRSQLEVVAHRVEIPDEGDTTPGPAGGNEAGEDAS